MTPVPLRAGGVPEHFNLPWHAHPHPQFTWTDYKGGTGAMCQSLSSNSLDFALLLTEGAVKHAFETGDTWLRTVYVKSPLVWGVHCGAGAEMKSLSQVNGKNVKFAISRLGSGSHLMAFCLAKRYGWVGIEFKIVGTLKGAEMALKEDPGMIFMWEKAMTAPLVDAGVFTRLGDFPTPWPCFVVAVRKSVRVEEVDDVLSGVVPFCDEFKRNRKESVELVMSKFGMRKELAEEWFDAVEFFHNGRAGFSTQDLDMLRSVKSTLIEIGQLSKDYENRDVSEIIYPGNAKL